MAVASPPSLSPVGGETPAGFVRQSNDVGAVGVHFTNVNVLAAAVFAGERDLRAVRRKERLISSRSSQCSRIDIDAMLIAAVGIHQPDITTKGLIETESEKGNFAAVGRPRWEGLMVKQVI